MSIKTYLLKQLDNFVIKYLTVERSRNRRKYIWKTNNFRETVYLHIPRMIFTGFVVIMIWKINDKVKKLKSNRFTPYNSKSMREEKAEKETQVN